MTKATKTICNQCGEARYIKPGRSKCSACRHLNFGIKHGTIREPDYPDITVDKYKEPMEKVENGFGYIGAVTETKDGKQLQCHICGYFFGRLSLHVANRHGISSKDYKIKYGLRIKDGLVSPVERKAMQATYNKDARVAIERIKQLQAGNTKRREKGNWRTGSGVNGKATRDTPQTRNEQGTCKAQTLAKIVRLGKMIDGLVTRKDFAMEYGDTQSIEHWFGSWGKAIEAAGEEGYQAHRGRKRHERAIAIPKRIKAFYKKNGRVPQSSDFNSDNSLPSQSEVSRVYGTLNNARVAAGVPQLVHVGYGMWEEVKDIKLVKEK